MTKSLFSSRIQPLDEWILVRIPEAEVKAKSLVLVEKVNGANQVVDRAQKKNLGIVVAVGPGGFDQSGKRVTPDARIVPGAQVLFMGKTAQRPPDLEEEMAEEGLYFVPASALICIVSAVASRATVMA